MTIINLTLQLQNIAQDIRNAHAAGKHLTSHNFSIIYEQFCLLGRAAKKNNISQETNKKIQGICENILSYEYECVHGRPETIDLNILANSITVTVQAIAQEISSSQPNPDNSILTPSNGGDVS